MTSTLHLSGFKEQVLPLGSIEDSHVNSLLLWKLGWKTLGVTQDASNPEATEKLKSLVGKT